jgi:hypothetical protein
VTENDDEQSRCSSVYSSEIVGSKRVDVDASFTPMLLRLESSLESGVPLNTLPSPA